MKLHEKQQEIVRCKKRFRVVCAGRRFGKSTLAVEEMLWVAVNVTNARVAYIAPTHQAARDIVWNQLKQRTASLSPQPNESRLDMIVPNASETTSFIALRSWDAVESLRGQFFDLIVLDEVAQYRNFDEGWNAVLRPALTDKKGRAIFISTPRGYNKFYELFSIQDQDYASFRFTSYDNPHIDPAEIDEARRLLPEDTFEQEYMAEFRKLTGLVYKEFDRNKHIFQDLTDAQGEKLAGIDFGFTNPTAVLTIIKDYDNHYWVTDEWYHTGKTDTETAEYVAAQGYNRVYPDPAAANAIAQLRKLKINVRDVVKGQDSIKSGIEKVRELFKQGRLHIHASCANLIYELETYAYPERKEFHPEPEAPIKETDHALDALRYLVMMAETVPTTHAPFYPGNIVMTNGYTTKARQFIPQL